MCWESPEKNHEKIPKKGRVMSILKIANFWLNFPLQISGLRAICTISSIKWAKLVQFTTKMAQMKAYTSVLYIIKLKLGQSAKNTLKRAHIVKKITQKIVKFYITGRLEGPV